MISSAPRFKLRKILITGASSGLGAMMAKIYAAEGAMIFICGRNSDRLEETKRACEVYGGTCHAKVVDVADRKAMKEWIDNILKEHTLDIVIANAGVSGGGSLGGSNDAQQIYDNFEQEHTIFDVNLIGVLNTLHPILPTMITSKKGQIAIISSVAGFVPLAGAPAYSASKAAVRFYGESLGVKLKRYGISVTVVCPGFIVTRMTEHNDFPMPFLMTSENAALRIISKIEKKSRLVVFPWQMRWVMRIISVFPSFFTRDIFAHLPEKHSYRKNLS